MHTGIYIDFDSIAPYGMGSSQYSPIREYYEASGEVLHMVTFMGRDEAHEQTDVKYTGWRKSCRIRFENAGSRVVETPGSVSFIDGAGINMVTDCTVTLTVQAMLHCERLDRIVLLTNNPAYEPLCNALRDKGLFVELLHTRPVPALQKAASKAFNPLLIPGVYWSKDQAYKQVVRVKDFNRAQMLLSFEYLERMPESLSARDPAWRSTMVNITTSHLELRKGTTGTVLGWNGGSAAHDFQDLSQY
ncbi:TPA: NYN domain-containing protein [Pseudomonas aeruginosa]|uniref:NYN domain-containing protein n=1 Tax=Pseudomonas aeruginosa TaxID=287 RepID=UPI0027F45071|nr:NYN domain-containing protein [Pseudomonas aeruginosa]ELJ2276165.1 NYN domain-containing protein [Pseudomonas aeruginosa]